MGKYLEIADAVMGQKPDDNQGRLVEVVSPLFGRCYGKIREVKGCLYTVTDHSVLEKEVEIPAAWVRRILDENC